MWCSKKCKKQKKERRKTCERWTSLEDDLLAKAIDKYGEKNWNEIAKSVGTKNGDQCSMYFFSLFFFLSGLFVPPVGNVVFKHV